MQEQVYHQRVAYLFLQALLHCGNQLLPGSAGLVMKLLHPAQAQSGRALNIFTQTPDQQATLQLQTWGYVHRTLVSDHDR